MTDLQTTLLNADWLEPALLLSREAGWNQVAADWNVFFHHGTVFGIVADDRLVATAATLPYGETLGWVSMVLVTGEWRRKGLASHLMSACIANLQESGRSAFLDAAPAAVNIYASLGFSPLCGMERWEGTRHGNAAPAPTTNLDKLAKLDQLAFGADRRFLLHNFISRPGSSLLRTGSAWGILREGHHTSQLGPILGDVTDAAELVATATYAGHGGLGVDVLDAGSGMKAKLTELGFQPQRLFTRMALGEATLPGNSSQMLAAAGPEFG